MKSSSNLDRRVGSFVRIGFHLVLHSMGPHLSKSILGPAAHKQMYNTSYSFFPWPRKPLKAINTHDECSSSTRQAPQMLQIPQHFL